MNSTQVICYILSAVGFSCCGGRRLVAGAVAAAMCPAAGSVVCQRVRTMLFSSAMRRMLSMA